jgi:hypothetical protein
VLRRRVVVVDSIAALVRNDTDRQYSDQQQLLGDDGACRAQHCCAPLHLHVACCCMLVSVWILHMCQLLLLPPPRSTGCCAEEPGCTM